MLYSLYSIIHNFRNYLILLSAGFICGFLVFYFSDITSVTYIVLFFIVFFILLSARITMQLIRRKKVSAFSSLSVLFTVSLLSGIIRIGLDEYKYQNYTKNLLPDGSVFFGTVISNPEYESTSKSGFAYIKLSHYTNNGTRCRTNGVIKLYYSESGFEKIQLFDNIEFYGHIQKTPEKYIIKERSNSVIAVIKAKTCIKSDFEDKNAFRFSFSKNLEQKIYKAINGIFYYNPKRAAIVQGILTGNQNNFSQRMLDGFSAAGFMHVVAVSGMHVSILLSIISAVLSSFRIHRSIITTAAIPILFIFCAVAGFTASSLRAAIMLSLSLFSMFVDREYDMKTALFFSALVILIIYPYKLFTPSFILSFGATLGIALFYMPMEKILKTCFDKIFIPSSVTGSISLSIAAFLGTAPFCAAFFGNVSFNSVLTNIWIIPVVTIIFCLVIMGCILYYIFPWAAINIIGTFCEPFLMIVSETAELFYNTETGIIAFDFVPSVFYGIYAAFIIIFYKLINGHFKKDISKQKR